MSETHARSVPEGSLNPSALTVAQLARLLGVAEEKVRKHVADGAPVAADGSINLVHYTAWLLKEQAVRQLGCSAVRKERCPQADPNSRTVKQSNSLWPGGPHD